jgi:hypothetical protein
VGEFITVLGGAAAAWAARSVCASSRAISVIGFLGPTSPDDLGDQRRSI